MDIYIFNNGIVTDYGMSGSDRRAVELSKIFSKKYERLFVVIPSAGLRRYVFLSKESLIVTSKIDAYRYGFVISYLVRTIKGCFAVSRVKQENGFIVYSTSNLLPDLIPSVFLKLRKRVPAKLVVGVHLIIPNPFKGFGGKTAERIPRAKDMIMYIYQRMTFPFIKRAADLVLVSNMMDKELLVKKGFDKNKLLVTYGACDPGEINNVPFEGYKYDACFVGRIHAQKGINDLIEIWETIAAQKNDARFVAIGELEALKPVLLEKRLENNVVLAGFLDGVDKYKLIKQSKVTLFPSTYESFGMVVCESIACGTPVLLYDLPVFKGIYDAGVVRIPLGDRKAFSRECMNLINDPNRLDKLRIETLNASSAFAWDKVAEDISARLKG